MNRLLVLLLALTTLACGDPNPLFCNATSDCRDPARPFCDLEGIHDGSDGLRHTCVPDPNFVTVDVQGPGRVTSFPSGIDCPGDCQKSYADGTELTLTATPESGSFFSGWSGDCMGMGIGDCVIPINSPQNISAIFGVQHVLTVEVAGSSGVGTIVSDPIGIDCQSGTCTAPFAAGTQVTLTATEGAGATFVSWSTTSCPGFGDCVITMDAPTTITGDFDVAGEYKWDLQADTKDLVFDGDGSLVVVGSFSGTANLFGLGQRTSAGRTDGYVAKLNAQGQAQWVFVFGSTDFDGTAAVALDAANDVYFVGDFAADLTMGQATYLGSGGLVAKLSGSDGSLQWSRALKESTISSSISYKDVAIDAGGRVVLVSDFSGRVSEVQWNMTSGASSTDVLFEWRSSKTGARILAGKFGASGTNSGGSVSVLQDGNVVFALRLAGPLDIGGTTLAAGNVLVKMNTLVVSWARQVDSGWQLGLATVDDTDTLWWIGDAGLKKYDSQQGSELFSRTFAGASAKDVAVGPRGNATMVGEFSREVNFGGELFVADRFADACIANFNASVDHRWSAKIGGQAFERVDSISVASDGRIAVIVSAPLGADFGGGMRSGGTSIVVYGP